MGLDLKYGLTPSRRWCDSGGDLRAHDARSHVRRLALGVQRVSSGDGGIPKTGPGLPPAGRAGQPTDRSARAEPRISGHSVSLRVDQNPAVWRGGRHLGPSGPVAAGPQHDHGGGGSGVLGPGDGRPWLPLPAGARPIVSVFFSPLSSASQRTTPSTSFDWVRPEPLAEGLILQ